MDQRKEKERNEIEDEKETRQTGRETHRQRAAHPTCSQGNATVGTRKAGTGTDGGRLGTGPLGEKRARPMLLYLSCRYLV